MADMITFVLRSLDDVQLELQQTLEGLTLEQIMWRPDPDSNSIAWIAWHIARLQDARGAELSGEEQLWVSKGWHERFGLSPDPQNHGRGHSREQVESVKPDSTESLAAYCRDSHEFVHREVSKINDKTIVADDTTWNLVFRTVHGGFAHVGQAMYVRGLIEKRRWFSR